MDRTPHRRPSPSMSVALLALFVALGGTAGAASGVFVRSTKQIAKGAVNSGDLAPDAVITGKIKDGAISLNDLGPGVKNALTPTGTQAIEAYRPGGPEKAAPNTDVKVATLSNIPPGSYAVFAKTNIVGGPDTQSTLLNQGGSKSGSCTLKASGAVDQANELLGGPGAGGIVSINMQTTTAYGSIGQATVECNMSGVQNWTANQTSIIAIRLGDSPKTVVSGR